MKIDIDINKIVESIDVKQLVEDVIKSDIVDNIDFDKIIDDMLEDEEVKNHINKKIMNIIDEYISSDEGKKNITGVFNDVLANSDILTDDKIIDIVAEFLREKLKAV